MFVDNNFLKGISFEENPYIEEVPVETKFYDMEGNEVTVDVNE